MANPNPYGPLTPDQRRIRGHIRAFLLTASTAELIAELNISAQRADYFRVACINELIEEQYRADHKMA